jgi:hypothetical protein
MCKTIQTTGPKKQISEFLIEGGKANVELNQEAVVFCTKAKDYFQRQQELFQECIDVGKDIESKASNLRKSFFNMGQAWTKLAGLQQQIGTERYADLCDQLAEGMTSVGENIFQTGELINSHLGSKHMKYHIYEQETLQELFKLREEYLQLFLAKEKDLLKKKDKLFLQTQDFA